ncbi:MAG: DUF4400 domain-containing protein [Pseudomonadota bacterium]
MSQTVAAHPNSSKPAKPPGRIGRAAGIVFALLMAVLIAGALSVSAEWIGIALGWWPKHHSFELLVRERSYVEAIDRFPLTALTPVQLANHAAGRVDEIARKAGLGWGAGGYGIAAVNTIKLAALRLSVCLFTIPAFVIVALVALFDGLVARDIRKYTGGHESSYVFHAAKRFVVPSLMLTVTIYLMLPISVRPVVVFGPALLSSAVMIYTAASRFKKYL